MLWKTQVQKEMIGNMKKINGLLIVITMICYISCNKPEGNVSILTPDDVDTISVIGNTELPKNDTSTVVDKITFNIQDYIYIDDQPLTKTNIVNVQDFVWSENDTVGIYPNTGAQVYFAMTSGANSNSAVFDGGGWDFKQNSVYYSYYPFIGDIYLDRNHIPVSFLNQKQVGISGASHIGAFDYMFTPGVMSDGSGNLSFNYHHLCCIIQPKVTLPAGTWTKLAVTAPQKVFAKSGYFDLMATAPAIVPSVLTDQMQIDLDSVTINEETMFRVLMMSIPVNLVGQEITVSVRNSEGIEYQCKKTPSFEYTAGKICGLTCSSWTEAPMSLIIDDWGDGGSISGTAE